MVLRLEEASLPEAEEVLEEEAAHPEAVALPAVEASREELAPLVGVDVTEKNMRIEDVYEADEIFLTGSAAEVIAVTRIGDTEDDAHIVGSGSEGTITNKLRTKFRQIVTSDNVPED